VGDDAATGRIAPSKTVQINPYERLTRVLTPGFGYYREGGATVPVA
jgi:hypothetical protein